MANLTYAERLALEQERDRLRREREDERRNGVAGVRANDSRISRNDDAMHGKAGRKWLGGEQGAVSDGSAMHGKAGRKWLGLGGSQDEEPRRSNISVYSNVDQLGGGRAPTVYEAGSDDDPTKEWTTAGLRQKAINAQRLLDQFRVGKNQRLQDAANSANADNEVLGRLYLSAFHTPRQLDANGVPMNTDMDAEDVAQIVGNNPRFAGISRAGIRMMGDGNGNRIPVLIYEKGGQMYSLDPNQAFMAANAFTGSQKATLSAVSGKGLAGAFGAKENKPSAVDVANARGEQGFLNSALKAAIVEDAEGNKVFSDEIFDKMVAAYKRAFGGGTATPAPTGGDDGKGANAVGTMLTKEQLEKQKQGGAIQMDQKGKTQNAATTAQPAQTQPAAPQNTAGVVEDAKPKYRGGQQQLDLLISDDNEANGYRRVTTNGYIGNDGKFYDGKGQQINGVVGTFKTDYERDASGNVVRNEKGNPARYVYTDSKFKDELEKRKQKQGDASGNNGETQKTQPAAKSAATAKTSTSSETATATSATSTETAAAPKGGEKPTGGKNNEIPKEVIEQARRENPDMRVSDLTSGKSAKGNRIVDNIMRRIHEETSAMFGNQPDEIRKELAGEQTGIRSRDYKSSALGETDAQRYGTIGRRRNIADLQTKEEALLRNGIAEGIVSELGGRAASAVVKGVVRGTGNFAKTAASAARNRASSEAVERAIELGASRTVPRVTKSSQKAMGDLVLNDTSLGYARMSKSQLADMVESGIAKSEWHVPQKVAKGVATKFDKNIGTFIGGGSKGEFGNAIVTVKKSAIGSGKAAPTLADLEGVWVSKGGKRVNILPELLKEHRATASVATRIGNKVGGAISNAKKASELDKVLSYKDSIMSEVKTKLGYGRTEAIPEYLREKIFRQIDRDINEMIKSGGVDIYSDINRKWIIDGVIDSNTGKVNRAIVVR